MSDTLTHIGRRPSFAAFAALYAAAMAACNPPAASSGEAAPTPSSTAASTARQAASAALSALPRASASAGAQPAAASAALSDAEFGTLVNTISEPEGKFPSDNFVSNESSYLHIAKALAEPSLAGGVYVGVGPEQNFTYLALARPRLAFVVDIRRENLLLHLIYKVAFEQSDTREAFLATLLSREAPEAKAGAGAPIDRVLAEVEALAKMPAREASLLAATEARAAALGLTLDAADRKHLRTAVKAFASQGLNLRYSMEGSSRSYPPLGELLAQKGDDGAPGGFLASDESYAIVRQMQRENRVLPLVGDLAGDGALPRLGAELKRRGERVTIFYSSNVEQYLFGPPTWAKWVRNLEGLPWSPDGVVARVYFDQGRHHPQQRKGERTTSLVRPAAAFLARAKAGGYKSWWDVATEGADRPLDR